MIQNKKSETSSSCVHSFVTNFCFFHELNDVAHFDHEVYSFHLVVRYHHAEWRLGSNTSMGRVVSSHTTCDESSECAHWRFDVWSCEGQTWGAVLNGACKFAHKHSAKSNLIFMCSLILGTNLVFHELNDVATFWSLSTYIYLFLLVYQVLRHSNSYHLVVRYHHAAWRLEPNTCMGRVVRARRTCPEGSEGVHWRSECRGCEAETWVAVINCACEFVHKQHSAKSNLIEFGNPSTIFISTLAIATLTNYTG